MANIRMQGRNRPFFVVGCARSGTTSLCRILDTAGNGVCVLEPMPNLARESRLMMEGRLADPAASVASTIVPRVEKGLAANEVYGEKNVTYGPFISHIYEQTGARFVFIRRDGRDVVRSLIDWHERKFGNIYRECGETGEVTNDALKTTAALPAHLDDSDFARPRPIPGEPLFAEWEGLSRFEMCGFYWSRINEIFLEHLAELPRDAWTDIDYTRPKADDVLRIAEFCGLSGLGANEIQAFLDRRINSLEERDGISGTFPGWPEWCGGLRRRFERLAGRSMRRLGYFSDNADRWKPEGYGRFWKSEAQGPERYEEIFKGRHAAHQDLARWMAEKEAAGVRFNSVADLGCGFGVGYRDAFADKGYIGVDLNDNAIDWQRRHVAGNGQRFICRDFIAEPLSAKVDLVVSQGTVDNVYDVDQFLESAMRSAREWIYLTAYRGWFPELDEHRYAFDAGQRVFHNDVSPRRIYETLLSLGCRDIEIRPIPSGKSDPPFETRMTARVSACC